MNKPQTDKTDKLNSELYTLLDSNNADLSNFISSSPKHTILSLLIQYYQEKQSKLSLEWILKLSNYIKIHKRRLLLQKVPIVSKDFAWFMEWDQIDDLVSNKDDRASLIVMNSRFQEKGVDVLKGVNMRSLVPFDVLNEIELKELVNNGHYEVLSKCSERVFIDGVYGKVDTLKPSDMISVMVCMQKDSALVVSEEIILKLKEVLKIDDELVKGDAFKILAKLYSLKGNLPEFQSLAKESVSNITKKYILEGFLFFNDLSQLDLNFLEELSENGNWLVRRLYGEILLRVKSNKLIDLLWDDDERVRQRFIGRLDESINEVVFEKLWDPSISSTKKKLLLCCFLVYNENFVLISFNYVYEYNNITTDIEFLYSCLVLYYEYMKKPENEMVVAKIIDISNCVFTDFVKALKEQSGKDSSVVCVLNKLLRNWTLTFNDTTSIIVKLVEACVGLLRVIPRQSVHLIFLLEIGMRLSPLKSITMLNEVMFSTDKSISYDFNFLTSKTFEEQEASFKKFMAIKQCNTDPLYCNSFLTEPPKKDIKSLFKKLISNDEITEEEFLVKVFIKVSKFIQFRADPNLNFHCLQLLINLVLFYKVKVVVVTDFIKCLRQTILLDLNEIDYYIDYLKDFGLVGTFVSFLCLTDETFDVEIVSKLVHNEEVLKHCKLAILLLKLKQELLKSRLSQNESAVIDPKLFGLFQDIIKQPIFNDKLSLVFMYVKSDDSFALKCLDLFITNMSSSGYIKFGNTDNFEELQSICDIFDCFDKVQVIEKKDLIAESLYNCTDFCTFVVLFRVYQMNKLTIDMKRVGSVLNQLICNCVTNDCDRKKIQMLLLIAYCYDVGLGEDVRVLLENWVKDNEIFRFLMDKIR